ncbi:hypothetical protein CDAR_74851 [Caerostris darwini]|uniref:Uncharacterized protein n=1 Tax=Caerostris darwini TaxID=1538125 RepID=A0AAV4NZX9_9ARAC|nr:hypothetical protein CDAR_74851 [Caerostris darwini]
MNGNGRRLRFARRQSETARSFMNEHPQLLRFHASLSKTYSPAKHDTLETEVPMSVNGFFICHYSRNFIHKFRSSRPRKVNSHFHTMRLHISETILI